MKDYFIKLSLRGISPMIWRRFWIPGKTSLAKLHGIIQLAFGWDNEHLHQFHIYGKDYGISYSGGLAFNDNAYKVYLDDFGFELNDKFTYEYNFFIHRIVDLRIEKIKNTSKKSQIYCVKGNGIPGASKYDEIEPTVALLKAIVNSNDNTTLADLKPCIDALNAVKFNKHYLNQLLRTELNNQF
jgi:hypothetical protein